MKSRIIRQPSTDQGTVGLLTIPELDRSWPCLELPWRDNAPQKSCIAPGTYTARLRKVSKWSPRPDGRLFGLLDVLGRSDIEIHAANYAGDVDLGWHSDLLGCIAPGLRVSTLIHPEVGREQTALLGSRDALAQFMQAVGDEDCELDIDWA